MRGRVGVVDVAAAGGVLGLAYRGIRCGAIGRGELGGRNPGLFLTRTRLPRPSRDPDGDRRTRAGAPRRRGRSGSQRQKSATRRGSVFVNRTRLPVLRAFAGVQRGSNNEEAAVGEGADSGAASVHQRRDLGRLARSRALGARRCQHGGPGRGRSNATSRTRPRRCLRRADLAPDGLQRPTLGAELARPDPLRPLGSTAHGERLPRGCDNTSRG